MFRQDEDHRIISLSQSKHSTLTTPNGNDTNSKTIWKVPISIQSKNWDDIQVLVSKTFKMSKNLFTLCGEVFYVLIIFDVKVGKR